MNLYSSMQINLTDITSIQELLNQLFLIVAIFIFLCLFSYTLACYITDSPQREVKRLSALFKLKNKPEKKS